MSEAQVKVRRRWGSLAIKGVLALAASAIALWWAFHDVDLGYVGARLAQSPPGVLIAVALMQLGLHGVRVIRWGMLIRPLGPATNRQIFTAASIGFPATFFLPLRLGEFVRPIIIARSGVPFAGAMASVVVERIADGVTGLGLFFVMLNLLPEDANVPPQLDTFAMIALVIFGGAFVGLIVTIIAKRPALALIDRLLRPISAALADRIVNLLDTFIHGATVLRTPGRLLGFLGLTLTYWGVTCAFNWLLADTYVENAPIILGPFVASVATFAIMIPAGPAFAGTLEAGFRVGMAPFGVSAGLAAVVAVAFHAIQVLVMAIIAGVGFLSAEGKAQVADVTGVPPELELLETKIDD